MERDIQIEYLEKPDWGVIGQGIREYNLQQAGDDHANNLCFVLRSPDQRVRGGVIGTTFWNWLHVDLMWLEEDLRHQGYGQQLLALAEDEARKRGVTHAYLDTYDFQAPGFYRKNGYQVFGTLNDYPPGHQLFFMLKRL